MPHLKRPDGVEIHWEERGDGPAVVLCTHFYAFPAVLSSLIDDLARDHRVLTYDLRGCGQSTRSGPYDLATDTGDLEALVVNRGGAAVAIGFGDGALRATKVAAARPESVIAVVTTGGSPGPIRRLRGREGLAKSEAVTEGMREMLRRDYRGALRTLVSTTSSQMTEDQARERVAETVAYVAQEAALARFEGWGREEMVDDARAIGDRLTILHFSTPWFPTGSAEQISEVLPEADIREVPEGPISRPDITAGAVRRVTMARTGRSRP